MYLNNLKQPDWCGYPSNELGDATRPGWGCWALLNGAVKCPEDCKEYTGEMCECFIVDWEKKKKEKERKERREKRKNKLLSYLDTIFKVKNILS